MVPPGLPDVGVRVSEVLFAGEPASQDPAYDPQVHILAIANELAPTGGLERVQLEVHQALHARGHRTTLIHATGGAFGDAWARCTDEQLTMPASRLSVKHPAATARTVARIARTLRRARPDVVYLHWYRHLHLVAPSARALGIPIVLHLHAPVPASLGPIGRRLMRRPRHVLAVSDATAAGWSRYREHLEVVHNGVDLQRFHPASADERQAARAALGLDPDLFVVAFAGRIAPQKGVTELIDAWRSLEWSADRARLVVAGHPAPDPDWMPANRATPGVDWVGFRLDVSTLHAATDVFAIPSTWADPGPLSVIEAMASGTIVVASAVGGVPELLPTEAPELLVPPGDVTALAARLRELRDLSQEDQAQLRKAVRNQAERHHDITRVVDRVEALLIDASTDAAR